jgi:hypothetical protein
LGGYDDKVLQGLVHIAKKHNVSTILVEPNFGGGMFTRLLQSTIQTMAIHDCGAIDADWSSTMKEQRIIDTLEPVMNQHRLIVDPAVIEHDYNSIKVYDGERAPEYRGFYQMTRMVRQKGALARDDRIDALAGAVAYFMEAVARDTQKAVIERKEAQLQAELDRFMAHALGRGHIPERPPASSLLRGLSRWSRGR